VTIDLAGASPTTIDPPASPAVAFGPREAWHFLMRSSWLLGILIPAVTLHLLWRAVRAKSPWPRWFLGRAGRASGARTTYRGTPLTRDVVFIANHISWLDILVIGGVTDVRFIAQDRIRHWPVIGWLAWLDATIFVSRTDRIGVSGQIERVRKAVAGKRPVALFPEGTTTDGRSLLPFKPSLLAALEPPPRSLRVQPVVLGFDDAASELAWIGVEGGAANALRVLSRGGTFAIEVDFLPPFDCAGMNRKAVATEARARIASALSAKFDCPVA
jgi:1-acyl-sn-glycerol-3-phosphate acyltransferase